MSTKGSDMLYTRVISITHNYLGSSADHFVGRQIRSHLHKDPEQLVKRDLADLIDWIRVGMGYITEDSEIVDEYVSNLKKLL